MDTVQIIPVILCGGSGKRLRPLSRDDHPKQFLRLLGDRSFLQDTALRAMKLSQVPASSVITVTLEEFKPQVFKHYKELHKDLELHVLGEPAARNTAAAIAKAALYIRDHLGENSIMWVLPADHYIADEKALTAALSDAVKAAQKDYLVTFGIKPIRADSNYGYIKRGRVIEGKSYAVEQFAEKPSREKATDYVRSGNYFWNSGMFVGKVSTMLKEFNEYAPDILSMEYDVLENISFDKAIMEKSRNAAIVTVDCGWSDVGSWESLWNIGMKNTSRKSFLKESITSMMVLLTLAACIFAGKLNPPFSPATIIHEEVSKDFSCGTPPVIVRDLRIESYYREDDPARAQIDPMAYEIHQAKRAPLRDFEKKIVIAANLYALSDPPRADIATCVLGWLNEWAQARALQGELSRAGVHIRKWSLGIVASSYLQIRNEPSLPQNQKKRVERWIKSLAQDVMKDYDSHTELSSRNNNHVYWAGYNVALAGAVLNEHKFYAWGKKKIIQGINDIQENGTLPLEMKRGSRALHYHIFALGPLVMMADLAAKNGDDLFSRNHFALRRAAQRVFESLDDPSFFSEKTGTLQDTRDIFNPSMLAWFDVYNNYYPEDGAQEWLKRFRPMRQTRLGGNVTLLYKQSARDHES